MTTQAQKGIRAVYEALGAADAGLGFGRARPTQAAGSSVGAVGRGAFASSNCA